jgi:hypothetical protein
MLVTSQKGPHMTTIILINAVSSVLAAAGIGGFLARERRRARKAVVKPLYVTTRATRSRTRR